MASRTLEARKWSGDRRPRRPRGPSSRRGSGPRTADRVNLGCRTAATRGRVASGASTRRGSGPKTADRGNHEAQRPRPQSLGPGRRSHQRSRSTQPALANEAVGSACVRGVHDTRRVCCDGGWRRSRAWRESSATLSWALRPQETLRASFASKRPSCRGGYAQRQLECGVRPSHESALSGGRCRC